MTLRPRTLQQKTWLLLAVALLGAIPYGMPAVWSTALGGGIQIVNLWAMERGVGLMLGSPEGRPDPFARVLLGLRLFALLAVVGLILWWVPVHLIGFVVGVSVLVPAVLWHGLAPARVVPEGLE